MAFMIYERETGGDAYNLKSTGQKFSLAGRNLIYQAWKQKSRPLDEGWEVSADELIRLQSNQEHSINDRCLIIDFDPASKKRIGLIELQHVYAFTQKGEDGNATWTPFMLKLQDVFYKEYPSGFDPHQKENIRLPISGNKEFVEFLYLNGESSAWTWGMSGRTNAVFLQGKAREYFRKYF